MEAICFHVNLTGFVQNAEKCLKHYAREYNILFLFSGSKIEIVLM